MGETLVISHLLVMGLISLIVNSIFLIIIAAFSFGAGVLYSLAFSNGGSSFSKAAAPFYFALFLFNIPYSVVSIIGFILGSSNRDRNRNIAVISLIVINFILLPVYMANCGFIITAYIISEKDTTIAASFGIVATVSQIVLYVSNIIHIVVIYKSFRYMNPNRQAAAYQGDELV